MCCTIETRIIEQRANMEGVNDQGGLNELPKQNRRLLSHC